jgi:hypothetical protein
VKKKNEILIKRLNREGLLIYVEKYAIKISIQMTKREKPNAVRVVIVIGGNTNDRSSRIKRKAKTAIYVRINPRK